MKKSLAAVVVALMSGQSLHAGGFSLYTEGSAAAIGNFAAGVAAEGSDASIGWYNPAGLVLIQKQEAVFSGVGVFPSTKLTGTSTFETEGFSPYVQSFKGLQGAKDAFVPAFHYVKPLGPRAAFGFSVVSPFGLSTDWDVTSPVRYAATLTKLITVTASPELGGQLTDNLSIGAGLDLQWARVNFNSVLGSPAALQHLQLSPNSFVTPTTLDSTTDNQGHSFGVGFHAGLLGKFNDNHTRLGLNYQSRVTHQFTGNSTLVGRLADPELTNPDAVFRTDTLMSNYVELPNIVTLSGYHDLNAKWTLLSSIVYTGWSSFNEIVLENVAAFSADTGEQTAVTATTKEGYRDAWRFAVGANYHVNETWMMRVGGGYDETPTVQADRDVRLPDVNRWALSIGGHYQPRPNLGLDFGYTYLFALSDATLDKTQALGTLSSNRVTARGKVHAQLVGLQLVWSMDGVKA
jgi:long-chain fatty acid transport protein